MSKGSKSQTVTTQPDAGTQAYVQQMRNLALGYTGQRSYTPQQQAALQQANEWMQSGSPQIRAFGQQLLQKIQAEGGQGGMPAGLPQVPTDPNLTNAAQEIGGYAQQGLLGMQAQTDPTVAAQFMNPYLNALNPFWDQQRALALTNANQQATAAGAFGGARSAITQGQALADIANAQGQQRYGAFNDAMNRALQSANLGLGATGEQAKLGQLLTFLPQIYASGQLGLLQQAIGPYGQTQSVATQSDPLSGLGGLGLIAAALLSGGPGAAALAGAGTLGVDNVGGSGASGGNLG